jgi:hypothetical protein
MTTVRSVPAWLDLNGIVPPALRDRMRAIADQLAALEPLLADLAAESALVRDAYHAAVDQAGANELLDELGALSGFDHLFDTWMALAGQACDVTECVPI